MKRAGLQDRQCRSQPTSPSVRPTWAANDCLERLHVTASSATTCGMSGTNKKLTPVVDMDLAVLGQTIASGGPPADVRATVRLTDLRAPLARLSSRGRSAPNGLPKRGADHLDYGPFVAQQVQYGNPGEGQMPERDIVEAKSGGDYALLTAGDQFSRSCGDLDVLGRAVLHDEVRYLAETAQRIAAILSLARAVLLQSRQPVREAG